MRKTKLIISVTLLTLAMLGATANAQPAPANPAPAMAPAMAPVATPSPVSVSVRTVDSMGVTTNTPLVPAPAMASPAAMLALPSEAMTPAPATSVPEVSAPATKAATGKQDPWWKVLLGGLLEILLVFVLAIAIICGRLLIQYIAKKTGVTDKEEIERMNALYDNAVTVGVNFAAQQAHKLRDDPDSKGKRLDWAVEKAQELIKEYKLPDKLATWIKDKIEAKIGEKERKSGFAGLIVGESIEPAEPKSD